MASKELKDEANTTHCNFPLCKGEKRERMRKKENALRTYKATNTGYYPAFCDCYLKSRGNCSNYCEVTVFGIDGSNMVIFAVAVTSCPRAYYCDTSLEHYYSTIGR